MAKLKESRYRNDAGSYIVELRKSRGKITVDEIIEHLKYVTRYYGFYAIIINANEYTCEPQGFLTEEPQGDFVEVVMLEEYDSCPLCAKMMPDPDYCPECGASLRQKDHE